MALVPLLGTFFRVKDEGCGESKIIDMYIYNTDTYIYILLLLLLLFIVIIIYVYFL